MIRSVYYDQIEILKSIMQLCDINRFCIDATYGNGQFYKTLPKPLRCFDLDGSLDGVEQASSDNLPVENSSIKSFVFDPPFLTSFIVLFIQELTGPILIVSC